MLKLTNVIQLGGVKLKKKNVSHFFPVFEGLSFFRRISKHSSQKYIGFVLLKIIETEKVLDSYTDKSNVYAWACLISRKLKVVIKQILAICSLWYSSSDIILHIERHWVSLDVEGENTMVYLCAFGNKIIYLFI